MFRIILPIAMVLAFTISGFAQFASVNYQGILKVNNAPANGYYDLDFKVYTDESGGSLVGSSTILGSLVEKGAYTAVLIFPVSAFTDSPRWLQIRARVTGTNDWFLLDPRQEITRAPFAVHSLSANNAATVGGFLPSGFIQNTNNPQSATMNITGNAIIGSQLRVEGQAGSLSASFGPNGNFEVDRVGVPGGRFKITESGDVIVGAGRFIVQQIPGCFGCRFFIGTDGKVGIGANAPQYRLHVFDDVSNQGFRVLNAVAGGRVASFGATGNFEIDSIGNNAGGRFMVLENGNVGIGTAAPNDKLEVNGVVRISTMGSAGGLSLCRNLSNQISNCSSSLRYKTNVTPFSSGLSLIKQLRPVTFDWKQGGSRDVGLGAEDVARIDPLFVTYNDRGEIEGVKYDRISVVLVNAVKEQQAQIETQAETIARQQQQIDTLTKLVCAQNLRAKVCKEAR